MQTPRGRTWASLTALALLIVGALLLLSGTPRGDQHLPDRPALSEAIPELHAATDTQHQEIPPPELRGKDGSDAKTDSQQELRVIVTVLDPDGTPIEGAAVELVAYELVDMPASPTGKALREKPAKRGTTSRTGQCTMHADAPGPHAVRAPAREGWLPAYASIDVRDGDTEVRLAFRQSPDVRIVVVDHEGRPSASCQVSVRMGKHGTRVARVATDAGGVAVLRGLNPEWPYILLVEPTSESRLFRHERHTWRPEDTRVVLERKLTISGRVIDQAAVPFSGALVSYRVPGEGSWKSTRAREDGSFVLGGLEPGATSCGQLQPADTVHRPTPNR